MDGTIFAGTASGIFISTDEARTWRPATGVAPSTARVISFATSGRKVFAGTDGSGMLMSSDEGDSWISNTALPAKKVRCLLAQPGKLYAGTDAGGVFVSYGDGQVWTPLQQGFPAHAQVFALSVVGSRLTAGLYSKGRYAWDDQLNQWTKVGTVSPLVLASIGGTLVAGHNPGGLYWSDDKGVTWSKGIGLTLGPFTSVLLNGLGELSSEAPIWELAANDELAWAGASGGIYYSEDRGHTWAKA